MLTKLTDEQLDSIAPISGDGVILVDRQALMKVLDAILKTTLTNVAISSVDYAQHEDGTPEPDTRTVKGIAWTSMGDNRCRKWSFRADGRALSTTDEGEQPCPISEDPDLIAKATIVVADQYPDTVIDDRNARLTVTLPNGVSKKARVIVVTDPRIIRAEDVLDNDMELIAFRAGTLGVALVQPVAGGQAIVRKMGLD